MEGWECPDVIFNSKVSVFNYFLLISPPTLYMCNYENIVNIHLDTQGG